MKSVVVIGCPFSGTKYITEVLRYCGIAVGHEKVEERGIVSWKHTKWSRDDFIREGVKEPLVILHQVKHPIMAISSIVANLSPGDWRWLGDYAKTHDLPHLSRDRNLLERSMGLWFYWNEMAYNLASYKYPVEGLSIFWQGFLDLIGVSDVEYPDIDVHYNRRARRPIVTWDQMYSCNPILMEEIMGMANHYGYAQIPVTYFDDPYYEFPDSGYW